MEKNELQTFLCDLLGFVHYYWPVPSEEKNMFSEPIFENIDITNSFKTVKRLCQANLDEKKTPISGSRRYLGKLSCSFGHTAF